MTQASLAAVCAIDVRTLQRWFAGQGVGLAEAELVAAALGVGTAEMFAGVPDETIQAMVERLRGLQRLLSARDGAIAQGLRLVQEHFVLVRECVSFAAHPARGFVSRQPIPERAMHGFIAFKVSCAEEHADIALRCQVGRHFGYTVAYARLNGPKASLVETFLTRSMLAERSDDGAIWIWFWSSPEHREVIFISDVELHVEAHVPAPAQLFDVSSVEARHALCVRPTNSHLRAAGMPMGFDRLTGPRECRVDVPLMWRNSSISMRRG